MSVYLVVRIPGLTAARAAEIDRQNPELANELSDSMRRAGRLGHRRLENEHGILEIDEWQDAERLAAFVEGAQPLIAQLRALRNTPDPTSELWFEPVVP